MFLEKNLKGNSLTTESSSVLSGRPKSVKSSLRLTPQGLCLFAHSAFAGEGGAAGGEAGGTAN